MDICLFGISALEALRAASVLAPEIFMGAQTYARRPRLSDCGVPHLAGAETELDMLGVTSRPLHVLVSDDSHSHTTAGVVRHICASVPSRSLVRISEHVVAPRPELCLIELASEPERLRMARLGEGAQAVDLPGPERFLFEADLVLIGMELCGGYRIDRSDPRGFAGAEPLMDAGGLARYLDRAASMRGVVLARRAAGLTLDGVRSPAEAVLAILLTAPRRIGGVGFPGAVSNLRVDTPDGPRFIDLAFPAARTGVEYQGEEFHGLGQVRNEDRRQNMLGGAGLTIFNVWKDDLSNPVLFDRLVRDLARAMGVRLRIRDADFPRRQALLRSWVLPPLHRYDDFAP